MVTIETLAEIEEDGTLKARTPASTPRGKRRVVIVIGEPEPTEGTQKRRLPDLSVARHQLPDQHHLRPDNATGAGDGFADGSPGPGATRPVLEDLSQPQVGLSQAREGEAPRRWRPSNNKLRTPYFLSRKLMVIR